MRAIMPRLGFDGVPSVKIAFFIYSSRDVNTYPSVTNAARVLVREGHSLDIYLPSAMKTALEMHGVRFIDVSDQEPAAYIHNCMDYIGENPIDYDFIFAFSFEALVTVFKLNKYLRSKVPTCYFSLELTYANYVFNVGRLKDLIYFLRHRDKRAIRYYFSEIYYWFKLQTSGSKIVKFSIIQDKHRGEFLKKEFRFVDKILFVPNSYIGYSAEASDFAYRAFGIPADKKILLYTGGVERGFFDVNLLKMVSKLNDNYVLFINAYSRDNYMQELIPMYRKEIEEGKIYINDTNLSEEDYDALVRSANICLAWYQKPDPQNHNMYYLGLSSGKLTKYLSCGKPVIAPDYFYDYRPLIEGNRLGRVCEHADEIPSLLHDIQSDYPAYSQGIKTFYEEKLEFATAFGDVLKEIEGTVSERKLARCSN